MSSSERALVVFGAFLTEPFEPFSEEAPGLPEFVEIFPSLSIQGIHLARRPLLRRHLIHGNEAAPLESDQQRVDSAFSDIRKALLPQPRRDLVAIRGPHGQNRQDDPLQDAL